MVEEDMRKLGYDKEEEYFYKLNKDLIEKKRKELDASRSQQQAQAQSADFWMRCPKCGGEMKEIELQHVKVDRCGRCEGIYFDRGELELLLESREPRGFLGGIRRLFSSGS